MGNKTSILKVGIDLKSGPLSEVEILSPIFPLHHQPLKLFHCQRSLFLSILCIVIIFIEYYTRNFLVAQRLKCLPPVWETWVRSLGREDPLDKKVATHSSILAWRIPWTEEPGRLQSTGSQRVGQDWATSQLLYQEVCKFYMLLLILKMIWALLYLFSRKRKLRSFIPFGKANADARIKIQIKNA